MFFVLLVKYDYLFIAPFRTFRKNNKFDIVGKPRPSGILQCKIIWKKEDLKLQKVKIKFFYFYLE